MCSVNARCKHAEWAHLPIPVTPFAMPPVEAPNRMAAKVAVFGITGRCY